MASARASIAQAMVSVDGAKGKLREESFTHYKHSRPPLQGRNITRHDWEDDTDIVYTVIAGGMVVAWGNGEFFQGVCSDVKKGVEGYWARKKTTPDMVLNIKKHLVVYGIDGELRTPLIKKLGDIDRATVAQCRPGRARSTLGYVWFDIESDSDVEDDYSVTAGGTITAPSTLTLAAIITSSDTPSFDATNSHFSASSIEVADWDMELETEEFMERVEKDWKEYEDLGLDMEEKVDTVLKEEIEFFL